MTEWGQSNTSNVGGKFLYDVKMRNAQFVVLFYYVRFDFRYAQSDFVNVAMRQKKLRLGTNFVPVVVKLVKLRRRKGALVAWEYELVYFVFKIFKGTVQTNTFKRTYAKYQNKYDNGD